MASPLREAVKAKFYPYAQARGFTRLKSDHPLFTTFQKTDAGIVYTFDIQWEKYHRPYFVVNFTSPQNSAIARRTDLGRLQHRRGGSLSNWFSTRRPWLEILMTGRLTYTPEEVVAQLIVCFPELEAWWASGHEGPHLYCTSYT